MAQLLMPKLSDTMEEGTVLQWLVADGEAVAKGQPLVEIETDKATMTVEAPEEGTLHVIAAEGDARAVGEAIAEIGGAGAAAAPATTPEPEPDAVAEAAELAEQDSSTGIPTADDGTASEIGAELGSEETYPGARAADEAEGAEDPAEAPEELAVEEPAPAPAPARERGAHEGLPARPAPGRRARAWTSRRCAAPARTAASCAPTSRPRRAGTRRRCGRRPPPRLARRRLRARRQRRSAAPGERVPLTRLQRTVAQRMTASTTEAPQFALQRDVDAVELLALRRQLVEAAAEGEGPSVNDLIVKAVAIAAAERPEAVSRFDGDALVRPSGIHVGIAVAVDRGLLVPVVRDADTKGVGRIAAETRDLAARCRDGSIQPQELEGSVISISNLGMFGIDRFTAIINPPETAILAVGRAAPRAVVRDGAVVARETMTLTLSIDHRAVYGADGARFLARVAELLERPGALVL